MKFTEKQIGLFLAFIFGIGMLIIPDYRHLSLMNTREISAEIWQRKDIFSLNTLQKWMNSGKKDYLLIDIRSAEEFERGHIRGAKNIPLINLGRKKTIRRLPKDIPIILYSLGEAKGAQAWIFLRSYGLKTYYLEGGYGAWIKVEKGESWQKEKLPSSAFTGTSPSPKKSASPPKGTKKAPIQPKVEEEEEGC